MDGPAFDVTELPPKRGVPPRFRRNRVATILTLSALGAAAFVGVQWGLKRHTPFGPTPYAEAPLKPAAKDQSARPRPHAPVTVGSDTPAASPAPVATAPPAAVAPTAPVPPAATVGLSPEAVYFGATAQSQAAPAPSASAPVAASQTQGATAEPAPAPTAPAAEPKPKPVALADTRADRPDPAKAAPVRSAAVQSARPRPTRVSAPTPPPLTRPAPPQPVAAKPSFDCRFATSPGERQVCRNPQLAALDARLDTVYRRALADARDPRGLKADQDRWMAVREGAALRDPAMVGPAYERRIAELSRTSW